MIHINDSIIYSKVNKIKLTNNNIGQWVLQMQNRGVTKSSKNSAWTCDREQTCLLITNDSRIYLQLFLKADPFRINRGGIIYPC